ncbi:B-cell antigen receptor complex-associated protein beta chain, partial [Silurus meridionalis]
VTADYKVQQNPRFYGVKVGKKVGFTCSASDLTLEKSTVKWYKIKKYEEDKLYSGLNNTFQDPRVKENTGKMQWQLVFNMVEVKDSGIYYCKINDQWGPGSELQVIRGNKPEVIEWRNYRKDIIIILQGFLLVLCIILPRVWYYRLEQKEEAIYEEPEHDHTYEGLEIEHCGDLYEDLTAFSQNPDTEASWE